MALASTFSQLGLLPEVVTLRPPTVADSPSIFIVGKPPKRAALLISPIDYPNVVAEAQAQAQAMRSHLGAELGSTILYPLIEGHLQGRSYVLLPFGKPLPSNRLLWLAQKPLIKRRLFKWLQAVAAQRNADAANERMLFGDLLEQLRSVPGIGQDVQNLATSSVGRLNSSSFRPRFTPMHNDLWKGNILLPTNDEMEKATAFSFFLIDWGGSRIRGFPFFDLIRLSMSLNLTPGELKREIRMMSKSVECDVSDVQIYIAAALGELSTRLGQFPLDRFIDMTGAYLCELRKTKLA
jgi:hypothetical protein